MVDAVEVHKAIQSRNGAGSCGTSTLIKAMVKERNKSRPSSGADSLQSACTRADKAGFDTESVRPCRMQLQQQHKPLIIYILEDYFKEITHMNKTARNVPSSTQLL